MCRREYQREVQKGYVVFVRLLLGVADLFRDIIRLFRVQIVPRCHPNPLTFHSDSNVLNGVANFI
jgi:hypothetical protein